MMKAVCIFFLKKLKSLSTGRKCMYAAGLLLLLWFWLALPAVLFSKPTSYVLEDESGNLLSAGIAADGQWRFPAGDTLPLKFIKCITAFEDKRFFSHPGIDPVALARAIYQNIKSKNVVSGGSTITMQVIRLSRGQKRNVWQKAIETILAVRLECSYSKRSILSLYAANAPFGSNVVGLEGAAWRYFGRSPGKLSWGEMAALCVLPNAPALVHPGRNRQTLLRKRNEVIDILVANKTIDTVTGQLAKAEPLPLQPLPLPQLAPHLLDRFKKDCALNEANCKRFSTKITTTISAALQQNVTQIIARYQGSYRGNGINNAAAMVMDVESGNVLAYVGNVYNIADTALESHVDVLAAPRSPGSTLKPLLYAAMQSDGLILPQQLVPDIPTQIGGYTPQNFNLEYDGAVPANRALSRSLNIPAVRMLQQYKYQRFYDVLKRCGFTTLSQPAAHYGLSLILGGCEVTPWELAGVYSSFARAYLHQRQNIGKMEQKDWHMPVYIKQANAPFINIKQSQITANNSPFDHTAMWHTLNAMQEVMRPGEEGLWNLMNSAQRIAWKTGTSFGFRDGWAIGLTAKYCVVVWVGNTDGEGRPDLTGIATAAPVLFDIFRLLPAAAWFLPPAYDYTYVPVCHQSGYRAGPDCSIVDTMMVSTHSANAPLCPFHHLIHLDITGRYRVTDECSSPADMIQKSWFILPPAMAYYYKAKHNEYFALPDYMVGCQVKGAKQMEILYPEANARLYIPKEITGLRGKTIFTATHNNQNATLFWHLDESYVGSTRLFHQIAINPSVGFHVITIVDEDGESVSKTFEIVSKD